MSQLALGVRSTRICVAGLLIQTFLFALYLSLAPQVHQRIHSDAQQSQHECAVTLIATGKCDDHAPPPVFVRPNLAPQITVAAKFNSIWVTSPFLSARIFEHAPPTSS